ncbi:MAG: lysylphosphatidylglycerol synthase transmembrane domain-containing protein [Nanoarchaeota archaeon]|nr:lysylphosphatidylglycerol synthase transmembrane domain-containing protein [Nanoarchaeota archaeon]
MNKSFKSLLQAGIGFLLFLFLFSKVGVGAFWDVLKTINLWWLVPSVFMTIPTQLLASSNLKVLFSALDKETSFSHLFRSGMLSFSIGMVAPGKLGDLSLVSLLREGDIGYGDTLAVAVADKIISLFVTGVLALLGIIWFLDVQTFWIVLGACSVIFFVGMFSISSSRIRGLVKKYILRKHAKHFGGFYTNLQLLVRDRKGYLFGNVVLTLLKFFSGFVGTWFLFQAFGLKVSLMMILFVTAITSILSLIPISISGLGVREGVGTYLYSVVGGIGVVVSANVVVLATVRKYVVALVYYLLNIKLLERLQKTIRDVKET